MLVVQAPLSCLEMSINAAEVELGDLHYVTRPGSPRCALILNTD